MGCGEAKGLWCGCAWAMVGLLHWGLGMATLGVWWDYTKVVVGLHLGCSWGCGGATLWLWCGYTGVMVGLHWVAVWLYWGCGATLGLW